MPSYLTPLELLSSRWKWLIRRLVWPAGAQVCGKCQQASILDRKNVYVLLHNTRGNLDDEERAGVGPNYWSRCVILVRVNMD